MKQVHVVMLTASIVAAVTTGIYAGAANFATALAATFTTAETSRHAQSVEFAARLERAVAEIKDNEPKEESR